MKHFFILNPASGPKDRTQELIKEIELIFKERDDSYEIYVTKGPKDSFTIASLKSKNLTEETIFYACGGDGTSFDVINGIAGVKNAYFAVYPIGSCNDFLKTFPEYDFKDLKSLVNGTFKGIDIGKANEYYYLNEINIGFDARVNDDCNNSKYKAINVKKAYNKAVIKNFFRFKTQTIKITSNNKEIINEKLLLLVFANGKYYGSKYNCVPYANPSDGVMDLISVKKVSRFKFLNLIGKYEKGLHLDNPKFKKIVEWHKLNNIEIESNEDMVTCLDGEIFHWKKINIQVLKHGIQMLFPKVNNE